MLTKILLITIILIQAITLFIIWNTSPEGVKELKSIFSDQQKLSSNDGNENENSNAAENEAKPENQSDLASSKNAFSSIKVQPLIEKHHATSSFLKESKLHN